MKIGVKHKVAGIVINNAKTMTETARIIVEIMTKLIIFHGVTIMYSRGRSIHQKYGHKHASRQRFHGEHNQFKGNISHTIYTLGITCFLI